MPGSVNRVILIGNLGRDPEFRSLGDGTRIASLNIATSEHWRDRMSGEKKEKTEWHRVTVWPESTVQFIDNYARKGDQVYVEGKIETRKWKDQQNNDRYSTEIHVRQFNCDFKILTGQGSDDAGGGRSGGGSNRSRSTGNNLRDRATEDDDYGGRPSSGRGSALDDEIPF